jgi:hypothetical protein
MQNVLNPLVGVYQTQLEASRRFADAIFSGTEKIDRVVIGATHRVFTEQLNLAQAMTTVRDPRNIGASLQSGMLGRNPDEAMNYQKEIMRIFAEMQNEIGRSMQDYVEQLRKQAGSGTASMAMPGGSVRDRVEDFNPVTSMFSVWESAFKEVAALAKNNMMAARSNIEGAADRAAQTTAGYAGATIDAASGTTDAVESAVNATAHAARSSATGEEHGAEERKGPSPGGGKRK